MQPYVKLGISGKILRGDKIFAKEDSWQDISFTIPSGLDDRIDETGFILGNAAGVHSHGQITVYLDDLYYDGEPDYKIDFMKESMAFWHNLHQDVHQFARLKGYTYLENGWMSLSCSDFGEMYTGRYDWTDYVFKGTLRPVTGENCFLNVRVQGAMRSYAVGFSNGKLVLDKNYYGYRNLCAVDFVPEKDNTYDLTVIAERDKITALVNGIKLLVYEDSDNPILSGSVGVSVREGSHCFYRDLSVKGIHSTK